jgi:hypothetical protein
MEQIDTNLLEKDDDRLMMSHVICDEADLFYLDCYLKELFHD